MKSAATQSFMGLSILIGFESAGCWLWLVHRSFVSGTRAWALTEPRASADQEFACLRLIRVVLYRSQWAEAVSIPTVRLLEKNWTHPEAFDYTADSQDNTRLVREVSSNPIFHGVVHSDRFWISRLLIVTSASVVCVRHQSLSTHWT